MTVHMVRLFLEPPKGEADTAVNNWVLNHNEWSDDPVSHSLTETQGVEGDDSTTYLVGDYRFIQEETLTTLLDDLATRLGNFQGGVWFRAGHHPCDHDEEFTTDSVMRESWTADLGTAVPTAQADIVEGSVVMYDDEPKRRRDFTVDHEAGTIMADANGSLTTGEAYRIKYEYVTNRAEPCAWENPEVRTGGTVPSYVPTFS